MPKKILHVAVCDKFIPPFIGFIKKNFDFSEHEFLLTGGMAQQELTKAKNIYLSGKSIPAKLKHYFQALMKMHQVDKIICHGLFDMKIVLMLFFMPWLLRKCYWVMWGADLYVYTLGKKNNRRKRNEFFRRSVIKKMGYLVTYIKGDVELARKWYGARGKYYECLMYSSNLYKEYEVLEKQSDTINIQVGNSADPSNNHIEALEKLLPYKDQNISIFLPLSYGPPEHAQQVIKQGKEWFGDKFKPLTEFMPFDEYLAFLSSIDIAIFNHKRQQAMGNTITLLGLGKTVYIRSDTTQWEFFERKNISIGDINQLEVSDDLDTKSNIDIIKKYFSHENYLKQLAGLF